jgi:hypothetical protein
MTIDLDDQDVATKEGLTSWEEHGDWHILITENGTATLLDTPRPRYEELRLVRGIVRYRDKMSATVQEQNLTAAKATAEKFLAKRPYKTAFDRILEGPSYDAPDPPAPVPAPPASTVEVVRPPTPKRVWKNVPITDGEDDD